MFINAIIKKPFPQGEELPAHERYLSDLPAVAALKTLEFHSPATFFVGENGAGKSTLLEAVAASYGLNPEGGSRNFAFSTRSTHSCLSQYLTLSKGPGRPKDSFFLRAESFYNVATEVERLDKAAPGPSLFDSYGGKSLHRQSHGESFLSLVLNRFWGGGLYLLDEPEAALSPARQLTLLAKLGRLAQEGSQLIIATHSPILMALPGAEILLFDEKGIRPVPYRETEHYQLTRMFLERPERMLQELFAEDTGDSSPVF